MDTRDAYAAKVANYSLLAAFVLQRLGQMRREAAGARPHPLDSAVHRNRFDLLHDMFAEALRAVAPVWTIANQDGAADIAAGVPGNRLASPAGSISEGLETYDLIASLISGQTDPVHVMSWIREALRIIETLRNQGIVPVLHNDQSRDFLDRELQPFLLQLKDASRALVFEPTEGLAFAHH